MPGRTWIYILLVTACSINYIDRVVLSVSAQPISKEFEISTIQLGYLFSAFLWSYLVFVLPWGIYVDRVGTRRATTVGMAIWSAATLLTGLSWNFSSAFASRLLMGFGESSTYPVGSLGWRGAFYCAGALGFAWLIFWILVFRQPEEATFIGEAERAKILRERGGKAIPGKSAPLVALLKCKSMWGLFVTQGCAVYTVYLFLTWLPSYLQATRGLTLLKTGFYTAIPYAVAVPGTMLMGALSDRLLRDVGVTSGRRRAMVVIMLLCSSGILMTPWITETWVLLALFSISLTCIGSAVGLNITLTNDLLTDPGNAGRANGFLVTGGNLFGVLAPIVTGYVISGTGSYDWAFLVAGVLLICGAVTCWTMTREPISPEEA
jgi:MFS family permease